MKPTEIEVGKTYRNKNAGRTQRKVLDIGDHCPPKMWLPLSSQPDDPGVVYEQSGKIRSVYLSSFAAWAGAEVKA